MRRSEKTRRLIERLNKALRSARLIDALAMYQLLQGEEPTEPRWPHRMGDLLQRMGRSEDAAGAYERAVTLYANQGFVARATAMSKVVLSLDPSRADVIERVDPEKARQLHRATRQTIATPDDTAQGSTARRTRITEGALELQHDESADDDEVRFLDPEEGRTTAEIDISELELIARPTPPPARDTLQPETERPRPTPEELAQLPSTSLFAEVPHEVFIRIVRESSLVDIADKKHLAQAGTTADALFILVEGSVEVTSLDSGTSLTLSEGDVAGISCLLSDITYRHDIVARGRVRALRVSKMLLDQIVKTYPGVGDVLLEILCRRLIAGFVRTHEIFTSLEESVRLEVARMFEVRRAPAGTLLLEAGKRSDGLYIPLLGELVARDETGQALGSLRLGRPLGQRSLLTRELSLTTVEAVTDLIVLRMPADRFHEVAKSYPTIISQVRELASRASEPEISIRPAV